MTTQKSNDQTKEKSLANQVMELIIKDCELVHNEQKEPYVLVNKSGIRKVFDVRSKSFSDWISNKYYTTKKSALPEASVKTVIGTLAGKAVYEGMSVFKWFETNGLVS
jgi:hypothetical protein